MKNSYWVGVAVLGLIGTAVVIQKAAEFGFVAFMIALLAAMAFWGWGGGR